MRGGVHSLDANAFKSSEKKTKDSRIEIDKIETDKPETDIIETEKEYIQEDKIDIDCIEKDNNHIELDNDVSDDMDIKSEAERIKEASEYSSEVNSYLRSEAELGVYQKAGLEEQEIGEKKALIRNDIDWDMVDEKGRTNSERIERGLAPLNSDGDSIELHHVGQKVDSPLAELTFEEHRGKGNDSILHDKTIQSEVHAEGTNWDTERQDYWVNRAAYNKEVSKNE